MQDMDAQSLRIITSFKAARAALNWTQQDLSARSAVSLVTIARIESGKMSPRLSTLSKLKEALEQAGVRIVDESPIGGFTIFVDGKVFKEPTSS
jgi:predicted transcriptional regulator